MTVFEKFEYPKTDTRNLQESLSSTVIFYLKIFYQHFQSQKSKIISSKLTICV